MANRPIKKVAKQDAIQVATITAPKSIPQTDNTAGCTREGQDFRDNHARFRRNKTLVLGVSRDSLASHEKFRTKQEFPFDLLSDPDETLCRLFDVITEKNMYGKKVMGIERSTFLIDAEGKLRREWRKVKVEGHVEQVLEAVRELNRAAG